jgi:hypothetical protein
MTLSVICKSCRNESRFNEWVSDRARLARKRGEFIQHKCRNCGSTFEYHVDLITAVNNRVVSVFASLILLVGTPLIVYLILKNVAVVHYPYALAGLIGGGLLPILVYLAITWSQNDRQRIFNRYKLKS